MGIIFDAVNHKYFKDGDLKPSVGEIVNYYLNVDLSNIPPEILKSAQDRGTDIHLMCDKILSGEDFETIYSKEYKDFEYLRKKHKIKANSIEGIVYAWTPQGDYCGTYDLYDSKSKILYDIKTSYEKHIEEWTLKTNLYRYALEQNKSQVKEIKIIYLPSEKSPNKAEVFNLEILPDSKVEEVVKAYYRQERPSQIVELKALSKDAIKQLALAFSTIERIQNEIDTIKQRIKEEMESRGIYNFQCPEFNISIRKNHIQKRFDGKKFKEDFPEIYEKYVKDIEIKSSINIDYKGE
ncbi:MAG: hypothetical protein J6S85_21955 [Methanobrevibacter sp.]|nr:hypothetical protein [Methanobrevibacter sp.]